jgi:hypothetical protein
VDGAVNASPTDEEIATYLVRISIIVGEGIFDGRPLKALRENHQVGL